MMENMKNKNLNYKKYESKYESRYENKFYKK